MLSDANRLEKFEILKTISFGNGVAEAEKDDLTNYFLETETWRGIWDDKIDVVLAPKGGGKSAIYSMLVARDGLLFDRDIIVAAAENPQGETAFKSLTADNPSEADFIEIWKLYFLVLIHQQMASFGFYSEASKELHAYLRDANLLAGEEPRRKVLRTVWDYIVRTMHPSKVESGLQLSETGAVSGFTHALTFDPNISSSGDSRSTVGIDHLYDLAEEALAAQGMTIWLCLDRLDVAFASDPAIEKAALRALFRVYNDLAGWDRISLKVFLRTDIWAIITADGFREASHIVRKAQIKWSEPSLQHLLVKRLVQSEALCSEFSVDPAQVIADADDQRALLERVFPGQVDAGSGKTKTLFRWCLNHTKDGLGVNAPRELIGLFAGARESQIERFETGLTDTVGEAIFHAKAFEDAATQVSNERLTSTIYAEFPDVRPYLEQLRGEKGAQNIQSLSRVWGVDQHEAAARIGRLKEIGIVEDRKGTYWVAFLYRPALGIIQGGAPEVKGSDSDE